MVTKNDQLLKFYKTYKCTNNHSLKWEGSSLLYSIKKCNKCGNNDQNKNTIRWGCMECDEYYCSVCFQVKANDYCPSNKHKLILTHSPNIGGHFIKTFNCDICTNGFNVSDGMWIDIDCNYTLCPQCKKDGDDVPYIIED